MSGYCAFQCCFQTLCALACAGPFTSVAEPVFHGFSGFAFCGWKEIFYLAGQTFTEFIFSEEHTQSKFRVIFKEGIGPCRTVAIVVGGIWHGWSAGTINGGAAGSIGNHHAVAKEAGNHMDIWSFAATCAGAGEFKIRWLILRPL